MLEFAQVEVQRAHRQEHLIAVGEVRLDAGRVVEQGPVGSIARFVADQTGRDLVDGPNRLVQEPFTGPGVGIADIARLYEGAPARPQHAGPGAEGVGEVPVQMDGVGGGEHVRLARQQLRPHHLLEELEPPRLLEPAQEPEADALLAAELVEGDAEELGGAVHDQRPDVAVEDSQVEPIEEDPGAPRVVDEELAIFEVARQVLDRRIEVPVPAVVLDGVVPEAEGVHGLLDPVLLGNAREAGGPLEAPPRPARRLDGGADGGVDAQKIRDGGGRPPAPAALGGDPESGHEAVGRLDAAARALDAVGVVQQTQVELGLGAQAEIPQRRIVSLVEPLPRDGQVDPGEGPPQARRQRIGDLDELARVGRLLEVAMLDVAVAEVIAELDVRGHVARDPEQPLQDAALDVAEPDREHPLQHPELEIGIPLDGELIVRQFLEDGPELAEHLLLVDGLEELLMLGHHEGADGGERGGQTDLEATGHRHHAVTLEAREDPIGGQCRVRIPEGAKGHALRARAGGQADAGQRPPAVGAGRHHLELALGGEDGQLPHDPVGPGAGLAVRDAAEAVADLIGDGAEHGLRAGQRHAADQMGAGCREIGGDVAHDGSEHLPKANQGQDGPTQLKAAPRRRRAQALMLASRIAGDTFQAAAGSASSRRCKASSSRLNRPNASAPAASSAR